LMQKSIPASNRRQQPQQKRGGAQATSRAGSKGGGWEKQLAQIQKEAFIAGKAAAMQKGGGGGKGASSGKNSRQGGKGASSSKNTRHGGKANSGLVKRFRGMPPAEGSVGGGRRQMRGQVEKEPLKKHQLQLKKFDASQMVWVGGLSKTTARKTLEKHFAGVVKPKVVEVLNRNLKKPVTAKVAFGSAEDAATAVDALNGSELDGSILEMNIWKKSDKPERPERKKGKKDDAKSKLSKVLNTKFAKATRDKANKAGKPKDSKIAELMKSTDASCKVWVGGLAVETTCKVLDKHFAKVAKPKGTEIMKKGTAVLAFANEEEVATVIGALNSSQLDGKKLEVDVWVKSEKKERPRKKKGEKKTEE